MYVREYYLRPIAACQSDFKFTPKTTLAVPLIAAAASDRRGTPTERSGQWP
jgi:hypothetical protein